MTDWRNIPSLAALRAFEAAVRCGSLSSAARELNVTHAAISGHVRGLESFFSTSLLTRVGQGMEPTPEGALLARGLLEGFEVLTAACRDLSERHRARPVAVTTTPTFAENWLMPRLGAFWAEHPDVSVTINPSAEMVDLRRDGFDLAIRYGDGAWPDFDVDPLLIGDFVVVASPSIASRFRTGDMDQLRRQYWLMSENRAEEPHVARALGLGDGDLKVYTLATNGMVLSAIRAGMGLGLQNRTLIQPELEMGRLVVVADLPLGDVGYYIVTRRGAPSPSLQQFRRWLRRRPKMSDPSWTALQP